MISPNVPPKFDTGEISEERAEKIAKSFQECEYLSERSISCPHCQKSIIAVVFSDSVGHQRYKCQKCKSETVINLAYFRRVKTRAVSGINYFGRLKVSDK